MPAVAGRMASSNDSRHEGNASLFMASMNGVCDATPRCDFIDVAPTMRHNTSATASPHAAATRLPAVPSLVSQLVGTPKRPLRSPLEHRTKLRDVEMRATEPLPMPVPAIDTQSPTDATVVTLSVSA